MSRSSTRARTRSRSTTGPTSTRSTWKGPGVDERTEVAFTGKVTWTVTFRDGVYVYHCDPHPGSARAVRRGEPAAAAASTPAASRLTAAGRRRPRRAKLVVTAGPGHSITLKTAAGKAVRQLRTGTYTVTVRDRSRAHNIHLIAPGFNKKTTVGYVGTQTWRVRLSRPGTLRYQCDPHARMGMRGSARIVS